MTPEQTTRFLKAKSAVALHDELGRVPTETEITQVFVLTRVMDKAVLGLHSTGAEESQAAGDLLETSMNIGYARVSTHDQTLDLQQDALTKAGCSKIFTETASGAKTERQGLDEALSYVRAGDTLVVWRLDRLGRSLPHLLATVTDLAERGVGFKSLTESIDTTTSGGTLIFHIFGALAEFERNLIRERTQAGLVAARARGRTGGRPKALTGKKRTIARDLYEKGHPITEICQTLKISRATLYRSLKTAEHDT